MLAVQWFRECYPNMLAFHVPNGEKRDRRTAEKLKRMGVLAGVWDWLVFPVDEVKTCIEFKSDDGDLTPEQLKFRAMWAASTGHHSTVRTLDEFKRACIDLLGPSLAQFKLPWQT